MKAGEPGEDIRGINSLYIPLIVWGSSLTCFNKYKLEQHKKDNKD